MDKADVPQGWINATVGQVVAHDGIFTDGDWVETKDQDPNGDVRLIQLADVGDGCFLDKSSRYLNRAKAHELNCTFLARGDLLVARMPNPLGRSCIFPLDGDEKYVTVVDVCSIRLGTSSINPKYIMYVINSPHSRMAIDALKSGSTRKRISRRNLARIEMPLAPLNEQRRIVAKIEELFSELDKGIESLKTAREQLNVYRQAVLKHAFEGKLTEQWREENKDKLERPEQLLARIKRERETRYEQQLEEWKIAVKGWEEDGKLGRKPSKPKRPTEVVPIKGKQRVEFPAIPVCWEWLNLKDVGRVETGTTPSTKISANYGGTLPFFKPTDLDQGAHVRTARDHLSQLGEESARVIPMDSTLVTCIGATIGKTGFAVTRCATNQQINSIIPCAGFYPRFVYFQTVAPFLNSRIKTDASATTLPILNKSKFGDLPFVLCSLPEQHELVRLVEERFAAIEGSEREVSVALVRAEAFRQSILKRAFGGQLVPQDPSDEPASVLLNRIKVEREQDSKNGEIIKKTRNKRKTAA